MNTPMKTSLWPHQQEYVNNAMQAQAYGIFADMGCITGDAIISVNRNGITRKFTLKQLYNKFNKIWYKNYRRWDLSRPTYIKSLCDGIYKLNQVMAVIHKGKKHTITITTENKKHITLTPDHELCTDYNTWVRADNLKIGDQIFVNGNMPKHEKIIDIKYSGIQSVYDVVMNDPYRNFIANQILVHNCGKTLISLETINQSNARSIIIVCPKSVVNVWPHEFEKHGYDQYRIYPLNKGTVKSKAKQIEKAIRINQCAKTPFVIIINYESIWRSPIGPIYDKRNRIISKGLLLSHDWDVVIADESHRIAHHSSKVSKYMGKLANHAKKRLALTGTPLSTPLSAFGQFRFLDSSIFGTSFHRFKLSYCVMGGFQNYQVIKYINMEDFNRKFYSISKIVKTTDVIELPDKTHDIRTCTLSRNGQKVYNELMSNFIVSVKSGKLTVSSALVKLLRLQQITGGNMPLDDGNMIECDSAKLDLLEDLVIDIDPDESLVIFCRFTKEIERVRKMLDKKNIKRSNGELSGQHNDLDAFQKGIINTLVVQIRSGGVGVDLTQARYCVYYSLGYSLLDYEQSLARIYRPGQNRKVTYYTLLAENTIDFKVHKNLQDKKKVVEEILKDYGDINEI